MISRKLEKLSTIRNSLFSFYILFELNTKIYQNCDIAIFVVRLIVAVRFPNTKSANSEMRDVLIIFSNYGIEIILYGSRRSFGG